VKLDKALKITLIILLIILVSIISFVGLFVQEKNSMQNLVKDYQLGIDLGGYRSLGLSVDTSSKTIYYDKDGKVVEEKAEDGRTEEVPVNSPEVLTKENYIKTKEIYEKRLDELGVSEYIIRHDEETGRMIVKVPEDSKATLAAQFLYTVGKFTIENEESNVLLDNSNIESVQVGYNTQTDGTTVYLNIQFNKDSIEKLKEISNTYVTTTDEEGNDTSKKISLKIDDSVLTTTSFSEEISNGILSLSVGKGTTNSDINTYLQEASNIAIILNNGKLPITYTVDQNRYVKSDITSRDIVISGLITAAIVLIGIIVLSIVYKKNGLLVGISYIGYAAMLLLTLRYTNVIISIEGLFAILLTLILNYIFSTYLLNRLKGQNNKVEISKLYKETILRTILILIPVIIIAIVACFTNWLAFYSFGAIIFWSILLMLIYHTVVTRTLVVLSSKN